MYEIFSYEDEQLIRAFATNTLLVRMRLAH